MKIKIVEYDHKWAQIYKKEAKLIKNALGKHCINIYHIGSTSIPGLKAKPKIDILVVVKNFQSIDVKALEKIGFEVRGEIIPTGRYFSKRIPFKINLHFFEQDNPIIEKDLKFRDWLRTHEEDRKDYELLKLKLAQLHDNGMEYCIAKTDFITKIINKIDDVVKNNQDKFLAVRDLNLPIKQYAITGSGPLGIRNLKKIDDIDIIVTSELWGELILKYGIVDQNNIKKITIPNSCIEIFYEASFFMQLKDKDQPTVEERIKDAEIIDGLPFDSLKNILYYKSKMRRAKDLADIKIIKAYLDMQRNQ